MREWRITLLSVAFAFFASGEYDYCSLTNEAALTRIAAQKEFVPIPTDATIDNLFGNVTNSNSDADLAINVMRAVKISCRNNRTNYTAAARSAYGFHCMTNAFNIPEEFGWMHRERGAVRKIDLINLSADMVPNMRLDLDFINRMADYIGNIPAISTNLWFSEFHSARADDDALGYTREALRNGLIESAIGPNLQAHYEKWERLLLEKKLWDGYRRECINELLRYANNCWWRDSFSTPEYEQVKSNVIERARLDAAETKRVFGK